MPRIDLSSSPVLGAAQSAMKLIRDAGFEARLVGGSVRNLLFGTSVSDADLATTSRPDETLRIGKDAGLTVIPTGVDHGTVTWLIDHVPVEITTLRADIETDGRHAVVRFTESWEEDAQRRDFTMNALYADAEGHVFDPTGEGLRDLEARRVRFIGEARERIREDGLRMLRFFRFFAAYGDGPADKAAVQAISTSLEMLQNLSGERIAAELRKLLMAPRLPEALQAMEECGLALVLLPGPCDCKALETLVALEGYNHLPPSLDARFAALLGREFEASIQRLRLSNQEARAIRLLNQLAGESVTAGLARRTHLYHHGADAFRGASLLAKARGEDRDLALDLEAAADWSPHTLPIDGRDVIGSGIAGGPKVGHFLAAIESWWIEGEFQADRQACLDHLTKTIEEEGSP